MKPKESTKLKKRRESLEGCKPIELPKIGDKIYVPTSLYLSHGLDDFEGGIATVDGHYTNDFLTEDHCNYYEISIEENPGTRYNLRYLLEHQAEWKKIYKKRKAHPDPDDRPEFNRWD